MKKIFNQKNHFIWPSFTLSCSIFKNMSALKWTLLVVGSFIISSSFSQQDPHFTRYSFVTDMLYNPAAVARANETKLVLFYRNQWSGLRGAPTTPGLSIETPLSEKAGLGFNFFQDRIGFDTHFALQGNYAYRIPLSASFNLSVGIKGGLSIINSNFSELITPEPDKTDPVYIDGQRKIVPRVGLGFLAHSDKTYIGLGVPALAAFVPEQGSFLSDDGAFLSRHFYLTAGHVFDFANSPFQIKPGFLVKYHPSAPIQIDLLAQTWYKDWVGVGISYRTGDAIAAMLDVSIMQGWVLSYAYDMTYSSFTNVGRNAHEIVLSISLAKKDKVIPSIHKFPNLPRF